MLSVSRGVCGPFAKAHTPYPVPPVRTAIAARPPIFPRLRFTFRKTDESPTAESVTSMMMVESALISGVTPNFTIEKTLSGNVVLCGPATKKLMTTSSRERVNARTLLRSRPA